MNQILDFFKKLFDSADWPPRWHCGKWTEFHGWLYIISDLLIWSAYFTIPIVIVSYLRKKKSRRFTRLYFLFAAFILACGATHFLDALAFWIPLYRLSALFRFITGAISWITVFYLVKHLPTLLSLKPIEALEAEIEQRKQSEEKFRGLLEAAPDAIVIVNKSGEIVIINRQTEKLFGYSKEELIGKMVEILIPANLGAGHTKKREQYASDPHVRSMGAGLELEAIKKDGSKFPVEISLSPMETADGTLISASIRDISERKKIAEKLKQAKDDFQLLIDNVKDYSIIMLDKEGKIASWNNGSANIKGYSETEIIGQPVDVFYLPEEKELGAPARNLQLALQLGRFETEAWRLKKDGTSFWANIIITPLYNADKEWYGYVKVTRDITEKKKTDERIRFLATIASNIQDPVISTDNDYRITQWNKAAEKLFEWTSEEVSGKKTTEIFKTFFPNETREQILQSFEENDFWQAEVIYHTKSGSPINVLATISHLRDGDSNITGNLILARNITQRKKAEDALSKLNEELEQKVEERTEAFRQSEEQYRYLFQNNPMPMWVINLTDFKFLDVNEIATLQYGFSREEFLSMTAVDIRPDEDAQQFLKSDHSFDDDNKKYNKGIWRHRKKDGSIILVDIIGHKILFEGIPARLILANDVTAQEHAKEKLENNEKRFRALVENNYDMISMLDESFKVIYRSPSVTRIMGNDPLGNNIEGMENAHPDDREYAQEIIKQALNNPGKPVNGIFRRRHADGHYIWLEGVVTNLLHDKDVQAYITNFHDISQRKKLEDLLHKANTLARIGSWEVDLEKGTVYWSNITREIHETEPDYTPTLKTGINFFKSGKAKDLIIQKVQQAIETGKPWDEELQIITAKNNERWIRTIGQTEFLNGKCVKIYGSFQDIDQRKKAEEKLAKSERIYKTIASSIPGSAILLIDINYRYLLIEGDMLDKFGYSRERLLGNTVQEVLQPNQYQELLPNFNRVFAGDIITTESKVGEYYLSTRYVPLRDESGNVYAAMVVVIDITELKKAESSLVELNAALEEKVAIRTEQLKKSNEELEAFSYSVSHDLRAPLRGIIGFTNILEEDYSSKLDDEAKRITAIIKNNTVKMGTLIDDLLSFSRLGRQPVTKVKINTNDIIQDVMAEPVIKNAGNQINWVIPVLPDVDADPVTIKQVWMNLISNAVKYSTKTQNPVIEIGTLPANNETIFFVKDNGVGFDDKYMDKLFKVFQRLHSNAEFEGTGVGLAIVEKIITRHGGRVWAAAELGKGACFYFSLPK